VNSDESLADNHTERAMNQDLLEKILACPSLPTLPTVAVQVLELTSQPSVSVEDIASTIQNDQGLAARVLKTVNSSFYGVRRPCSTINQAVVMLGLGAVKSLALSFSLVNALNNRANSEFDYLSYWRRGLYTAVAAKCIARDAVLAMEEEAFLGGLLQDVGIIGMFHGLERQYLTVLLKTGGDHRSLVKHELAELELQHPDVGAMMCERWKLPQELIVPVRFHERPTAAPDEYASLVRAVALGNTVHDILTDADPKDAYSRFTELGRQWFDFDDETCTSLIRRISEGAKQVSSLFRLDVGASGDVEDILARAHRQREALSTSEGPKEAAHGARLGELLTDSDEFDALTGALTRRAALTKGAATFTAASSAGKSLSVVIVSIDAFSSVLARAGSGAADAVLAESAHHLFEAVESAGGIVARWDNSSFCLLLPGFDRPESSRTAAEVRQTFETCSPRWRIPGWTGAVTVSIGSATRDAANSGFSKIEQLLTAATKAVQAATAKGNCVRTFVPRVAA
jgi:two-component system, cell cycle response regulator